MTTHSDLCYSCSTNTEPCVKCGKETEGYSVDLSEYICVSCDVEFDKWLKANPDLIYRDFLDF
jgi:hypothetical protein